MNFRTSGRDKERGATLVEAAIALPILLLVVIAILEFGLLFKDYLTVSYLSREAARIGALAGDDPYADCAILLGIEDLATEGQLLDIATGGNQIEIYHVSTDGSQISGSNTGVYKGGGGLQCTVNPGPQATDSWQYNSAAWAPTSRGTEVGQNASPDIIGVRIQMQHDWVTNFPPFQGTVNINEETITRLEPKSFVTPTTP